MTDQLAAKSVLICDTQPVAVEGMRWLIDNSGDMRVACVVYSLEAAHELLYPAPEPIIPEPVNPEELNRNALDVDALIVDGLNIEGPNSSDAAESPVMLEAAMQEEADIAEAGPAATVPVTPVIQVDAIVIDKGLGTAYVIDWLRQLVLSGIPTAAVVWGSVISEADALRLLQAGAKGILRRTSESGTLLTCLRAVTSGGTWMEDGIFGSTDRLYNPKRSQLTARESEVVVLVEKGLRNRDIARTLGIQTGTVKIHLKHIFEKTGVRGRYGLALTGMRDRGTITLPPRHFAA